MKVSSYLRRLSSAPFVFAAITEEIYVLPLYVSSRPPHSDQGSQYTATRFKDLIARHGALQSMSRRGNCYDNANAESFWSRFKAELLDDGRFPGLTEARLEMSHHIANYNAERRHSALGYHAPNHFEIHLQTTSQFCPA